LKREGRLILMESMAGIHGSGTKKEAKRRKKNEPKAVDLLNYAGA